jgi:hypothetical protein
MNGAENVTEVERPGSRPATATPDGAAPVARSRTHPAPECGRHRSVDSRDARTPRPGRTASRTLARTGRLPPQFVPSSRHRADRPAGGPDPPYSLRHRTRRPPRLDRLARRARPPMPGSTSDRHDLVPAFDSEHVQSPLPRARLRRSDEPVVQCRHPMIHLDDGFVGRIRVGQPGHVLAAWRRLSERTTEWRASDTTALCPTTVEKSCHR